MTLKFFLVLTLMLSITVGAQKCNFTFSGKVEDFHDKTTIVNATVFIKSQNKYAVTDVNGNFTIKKVCRGNITIEISHVGCETKTIELFIDKNVYKIIDLEHHIEALKEVTIKDAGNSKTATKQTTTIKAKAIESYSDLSLGDALKEVSGVSSLNTGNTIVKPIINGLHSSRVLVNVNGVRLQDQEWGVEHAPNVDINTAESIAVIKGANALEYGGDAIGGVVVISPIHAIIKDTLYGKTIATFQTNANAYSINSSLNKSFKKGWYINGNVSYKRYGDSKAADYNLTNTGLNSKAFAINTGYKKFEKGFEFFYSYLNNEIGILRASHVGTSGDLIAAIRATRPSIIKDFSYNINNPKQDVTHHLAKILMYKRFKGLGKLDVQYDFQYNQRFEYDIRRGDDKFKPSVDLTLKTHSLKSDFKFDSNNDRIYKIGISGLYQNNFPDPETGVRRLIPDYDKYGAGIYAIGNFIFDNYTINTALRYDFTHYDAKKFYKKTRWENLNYDKDFNSIIIDEQSSQYLTNPVFTYHNMSASAGIKYQFNDENSVLLNYGLASRAPNPSELFSDGLHHSAARIELGDLRIKPEKSHRIGTTYSFKNETLSTNIEAFFNRINDFIYIRPSGFEQTLRGGFLVYNYVQTNANILGVDITAKYNIHKNWSFENKSAYIFGQDTKEIKPLVDIPALQIINNLQYTNEQWYNFTSKLQSEFVGKQTRYPNNNFLVYIPEADTNELADVSSTPKAYHLLNFSSDMTFKLSKTNLNIGFSIDNILNTNYRNYLNRFRFFADDLGRNFKIKLNIKY